MSIDDALKNFERLGFEGLSIRENVYKISNKFVYEVWKRLCYSLVGNNISNKDNVVSSITGITISPKKNFCIIKIWLSNCNYQNPDYITCDNKYIVSQGCLFKKHVPEY